MNMIYLNNNKNNKCIKNNKNNYEKIKNKNH